MTMTDPIADLLTRVRNGQRVGLKSVTVPASRQKEAILKVLLDEGYIAGFEKTGKAASEKQLVVELKYFEGKPVIEEIRRVSRPGLRIYRRKDKLPKILGGFGLTIVSTPSGLMSDRAARANGLGGEVVCVVS